MSPRWVAVCRAHTSCEHAQPLLKLVPRDQLVLLSPDAPAPLTHLDTSKAYVVGGIVDATVLPGQTAGFAAAHALECRRLPIQEHAHALGLAFPGASLRPALSIADVVLTLLEYQRSGGDWVAALAAGMPSRRRRRHGAGQLSEFDRVC
jgi:hypothetical protein